MNAKILAVLLSVALTGAAGAAQARNDSTFRASSEAVVEAQNNPVLPPLVARADVRARLAAWTGTFKAMFKASAAAVVEAKNNPVLPPPAPPADVRARLAAWTGTFKTMFKASAAAVVEAKNNPVLPPPAPPADVRARLAAWTGTFKTMFDPGTMAKSCMAHAVYFEARSESQLGQLAVATVILNRAKAANYPSSICGVVYQGASRPNACQFSFACDGQSDLPLDGRAWDAALAVTALALSDDKPVQSVAAATHYHADYVDPVWSKSLHRLTKIGRHIFYSQG